MSTLDQWFPCRFSIAFFTALHIHFTTCKSTFAIVVFFVILCNVHCFVLPHLPDRALQSATIQPYFFLPKNPLGYIFSLFILITPDFPDRDILYFSLLPALFSLLSALSDSPLSAGKVDAGASGIEENPPAG